MPAVADMPPKPIIAVVQSVLDPQGREGQSLVQEAEKAFLHWENRAERLLSIENGAEEDAFSYEHVPLTKVGTIRVRYKTAQPLKPRRFTVEDDVE
ncbi:MAG: hypothetical protein IH991_00130 [Planctomycetes bacterium]|nr:hypothetical protein [Planctomycetota bacterium]